MSTSKNSKSKCLKSLKSRSTELVFCGIDSFFSMEMDGGGAIWSGINRRSSVSGEFQMEHFKLFSQTGMGGWMELCWCRENPLGNDRENPWIVSFSLDCGSDFRARSVIYHAIRVSELFCSWFSVILRFSLTKRNLHVRSKTQCPESRGEKVERSSILKMCSTFRVGFRYPVKWSEPLKKSEVRRNCPDRENIRMSSIVQITLERHAGRLREPDFRPRSFQMRQALTDPEPRSSSIYPTRFLVLF
jgi:hypothetical protein